MKKKLTIKNIKILLPQFKPYEILDEEIKGFLLRVQPSGIMTYYFSYRTNNGVKKRYKIGRHGSLTPIQARDIAIKLSGQFHTGIDIQANKKQVKMSAEKEKMSTLEIFLTHKYQNWVKIERKRGEETINRIKYCFKEFLSLPMSSINLCLIENWRTSQIKLDKSPSTINRDIAALRSCFSKALDWDILDSHPLTKLKPLKTDSNKKIRYLSKNEELRLRKELITRDQKIKAARQRTNLWRKERKYPLFPDLSKYTFADYLQPMVLLSVNTGLRQGELFSLVWEDVDLEKSILTVRGTNAKNGKTRHIPLNEEAQKILHGWKAQTKGSHLIFPGKKGKFLNNVRKSWLALLSQSNITNFRWHDIRHHFASKLVMMGVDLNTVRELLGHSDIKMTLRYAHLAPEHKANAVAKLAFNYSSIEG